MSALKLSVLDQSPIAAGSTGRQALENSISLAQRCDELGYTRYWLAEHHATPSLAGAAPEALIGVIARATRRIRVGSGGIMLPHYSPFKVAETFSLLEALAPGRIDLGVGRAPGSDQRTAYALQRDRRQRAPNDFPNQLAELLAYLDGTLPADHPFAPLADHLPGKPAVPDVWMLGSSPDSAQWAAETGLPYCFADFIGGDGSAIVQQYRTLFTAARNRAAPEAAVAVWAICADSDAEAARLATSGRMMLAHLLMGELIPVPHPDEAQAWLAAHPQAAALPQRRIVAGSPATVCEELVRIASDYGAGELMLVNILHDHAARVRSYELVARAFNLNAAAQAA